MKTIFPSSCSCSYRVRKMSPIVTEKGFTLVELMVALALAGIISVTIMVISNTARQIYEQTTRKVELSNRFRLAFLTLDRDLTQWLATSNLEFFADGRGTMTRRNLQWDEGEELPDKSDELGPGVLDGGVFGEFDEFASITERHYLGVAQGFDPQDPESQKIHDAYQAYFRTYTYIHGKTREANVEYMLVDPNRLDQYGNPLPPVQVVGEKLADLVLLKIVRFHDINYQELFRKTQDFVIKRRRVEVASNVTDFRVEYTVENRFNIRSAELDFKTPREDYEDPGERAIRPEMYRDPDVGTVYRKLFGYGSAKVGAQYPKASAFKAIQGDRTPKGFDHQRVRFGWRQSAEIQFAELVLGDQIYIFTETNRGANVGGGGGISRAVQFPAGIYTVKGNISGQLEFCEDLDSTNWRGDQPGILYKAAYLPAAVRITMRVVDDKGLNPKTLQRVIWVRRKAR